MTIIIVIDTQTFAHRIERFNGRVRNTNASNVAPLWVAKTKWDIKMDDNGNNILWVRIVRPNNNSTETRAFHRQTVSKLKYNSLTKRIHIHINSAHTHTHQIHINF